MILKTELMHVFENVVPTRSEAQGGAESMLGAAGSDHSY